MTSVMHYDTRYSNDATLFGFLSQHDPVVRIDTKSTTVSLPQTNTLHAQMWTYKGLDVGVT